jgi:hypothetical protein
MAVLVRMTIYYPTFLWLFSGNMLFYIVNVEENGNEIFFMLRNIGLILMIFWGYLIANKIIELRSPKVRESL